MKKILKILFSRYTVYAAFILAEVLLLAYFVFYAYTYSLIFVLLSTLVNISVLVSLINRDTNPEFKLTWLSVVTFIPVFGGILYLIFYERKLRRREARFLAEMYTTLLENEKASGERERSLSALAELSSVSRPDAGRALALMRDDALAGLYRSARLEYYPSGEELYGAMLEEMESAEKYIFLEYFILSSGVMWQGIEDILVRKAAEGVDVRLLYDDFGSMGTLPKRFCRDMRQKGIKCYAFSRITPTLSSSHNNRDHRKICVVDGRAAFTGGMNIADEYINKRRRFGHWKDGGIKIEGAAVRGFVRLFLVLYDLTRRDMSDYKSLLPPVSVRENAECTGGTGFVIPFGSGPAPTYPEPVGKNLLMNVISSSDSYLYITTPYLIIDYDITEALRNAAKRGVDVRIITPGIADKRLVKVMTKSAYPYLIKAGVRIFEYTPGFIHEKMLVSDGRCAVVSTINMDYRSLVHHFEDGIMIYGDEVISRMRDSFLETEGASAEITPADARLGFLERVARDLIRVFAPLL